MGSNHFLALEIVVSTNARPKNRRKTKISIYDCLKVNFVNILESLFGFFDDFWAPITGIRNEEIFFVVEQKVDELFFSFE
jgi:hypothetical protein